MCIAYMNNVLLYIRHTLLQIWVSEVVIFEMHSLQTLNCKYCHFGTLIILSQMLWTTVPGRTVLLHLPKAGQITSREKGTPSEPR